MMRDLNVPEERRLVLIYKINSQREFGVIFSATDIESSQNLQVHVLSEILMDIPAAGETWAVHGNLQPTHRGPTIKKPSLCYRTLPNGRAITNFLADKVPGIGPERAQNLWREFGTNLEHF